MDKYMIYFTYALKSLEKNFIYIGITDNPEKRLSQHNKGQVKSTKFYKSFKMIFKQRFSSRIEARKREKYLKSGCGKEYLKSFIK